MIKVLVRPSVIILTPYRLHQVYALEKMLAVWDPQANRYTSFLYEFEAEDEKKDPSIKNFGDPRDEQQVAERVEAIQAQLQDLGVVNPQTGVAYTDEELKAIIQFVNGAYLPEKEADAYTMVDETLNFYTGIISAPKTLNMVQYQANSDVVTEDIVRKDIQECAPFDYSLLLMGDSYCYEVIEYFNGMYAKLLSTTDRAEFQNIHNALYKSLADFMYGDGLVLGDRTYRLKDLEGLQNQNDEIRSFLLIGQSNMAGRGYLNEAHEIDTKQIYTLRNGRWQRMFRPINPDRGSSGVSLAESFAEAYSEYAVQHPAYGHIKNYKYDPADKQDGKCSKSFSRHSRF